MKNKRILISGGTGSWGQELTKQLLTLSPKQIIIYSRNEFNQVKMKRAFDNKKLKFMIGDVRDYGKIKFACKNVDYVFHLAALKHVPIAEQFPYEAIKTNINGTRNVIRAAIDNNVKKVIDVSTDKACLDFHETITLSDGSKCRISDIVKNKESLLVKSWDGKKFVSKQIVGWYKNKLKDRDIYKITYIDSPKFGKCQSSMKVTEDHPILTDKGWKKAQELKNNEKILTDEVIFDDIQRVILLGTLMGDSNISKKNKKYNRGQFRVSQCYKQKEWIELKHSCFKATALPINKFIPKQRSDYKRQPLLSFCLKSNIYISYLHDKCYDINNKKHLPRKLIKKYLNNKKTIGYFLASLLMDDGCKTDNLIRIATHGFSKQDVDWLAKEFTNIGIIAYTYACKYKNKYYYELRLRKEGSVRFTEIVDSYIPTTMRYKLPEKYVRNGYNKKLWDMGNTVYLKSQVIVEKLKYKIKRDVYCIDVEDTHNFVVKGMIVHNCAPLNTYGLTKAVGERLILNASQISDKTKFMCIRAGNVMGTAGSVIPLFIDQIKKYNEITITDKRMTRYFISLHEAISLLFVAINSKITGSLFVMKMPACRLIDLARVLINHYGNKNTKIKEIGIRPGEKLEEVLVSKYEVLDTYEYNGTYYLIYPQGKQKLNLKKVTFPEYSSFTYLMNKKEIKRLLKKGDFLK